jgi:hypothetical protein
VKKLLLVALAIVFANQIIAKFDNESITSKVSQFKAPKKCKRCTVNR